jgi:hypothetical protein
MLRYAASCVTPEILDEVLQRHPGVDGSFQSTFNALRGPGHDLKMMYRLPHCFRDQRFASFCDAIQCALELASTNPSFGELIAKACGQPQGIWTEADLGRSPFVKGSHWKVLNWKPALWSIPSETELAAMENLLTEPGCWGNLMAEFPEAEAGDFDCTLEYRRVRWYFSATTIAIDFLGQLPREERMRLRCLVLDENRRGVANSECHAEGLIPFCHENKDLRVKMLSSIRTNMVPSLWVNYWGIGIEAERNDGVVSLHRYLYAIIDWFVRSANLCSNGMPPDAFTMILEGRSPEMVNLWTTLKQLAAIKDAALNCAQRRNEETIYIADTLLCMYDYAWELPSNYPSAIRNIVQGTSVIRFDGEPGELWDVEGMVDARIHWSSTDWHNDHSSTGLQSKSFRVPGGARAYFDQYRRGVEDEART